MKNCVICGAQFPPGTAPTKKYCADCAKKQILESTRRSREKQRERYEELKAVKAKIPKPAGNKKNRAWCSTCIYRGGLRDGTFTCDYILHTGKRRGCKPGYGCERKRVNE